MKNILLLTVLSLSLIGCESNNDSQTPVDDNTCTLTTNVQFASIRTSGVLAGPPPPPSECQEIVVFTNNGTIDNNGRIQNNHHMLVPKGYNGTFKAIPANGYIFDGWYSDGVKVETLTFTYDVNVVLTFEAKMIPVSVQ